jgi:predicted metal-dependent phosphoesterase TrpH
MHSQERADLHCHTTFSDGSLTPQELVAMAKKNNLTGLAITDHDTVGGFASAFSACKENRIKLLSGIELSTVFEKQHVHVLGYAFHPDHPALLEFCSFVRECRIERNREILHLLAKKEMPLEEADITPTCNELASVGRPHIAQAMVKKGYVRTPMEAFRKYIGEGKPCYVSGKKCRVEEGIEIIHQAQGKAVIAHPHLADNESIVQKVLQMPFDGIEVHYSLFPKKKNERWAAIAREKKWLATGGSDFHGSIKPEVQLGCSLAPHECFEELLRHFYTICPEYIIQ